MTEGEMRERVAGARVARLATVGGAGEPHLVPFCFVLETSADVIYSAVDLKPKRTPRLQRLADVAAEPRVAVLVDHYDEDWSRLWWVRADGRARELPAAAEEGRRALGLLAEKYEQYRRDPPPGPVLAVAVERWRGWSAS